MCESVRGDLLSLVGAGPRDWGGTRGAGKWSLAQQLDHLIRSEVGTSKMARRLIRGDFDGVARPVEAPLHDSSLAVYPYSALPAPDGLEPEDAPVFEPTALAAVHQRFLEELTRFAGPDPDALAAPDPATGVWFTLAGWVRLQALHEAHHVQQIRSLLKEPGR